MVGIQGVLFDLDDTLYSREAVFTRWAERFLTERLGLTDSQERAETLAWMDSLDPDGYGSKMAVFQAMHRRYPALAASDETTLDAMFAEFHGQVVMTPETKGVLDALEAAGIPFGVVTNGTERQWRKIDGLGLRERTDCLFVSDTFGAKKPHPSIFLAAAKKLGIPPGEIVFVGDHPINDMRGARAAGMRTAWLHRGKPWPHGQDAPDATLDRLADLRPLLALD